MNTPGRIISLDVFRGITIASMILVNTPGSWAHVYPPLLHAPWHGITPTDLVFPFFLFAVGVAMSFSLRKYSEPSEAWKKIITRTLLIFLIGLMMNAFPFFNTQPFEWIDFGKLRIMGVLQRIALAYGLGAALCYTLKSKKSLIYLSLAILLVYWGILVFFGTEDPFSLEGNAVLKLDRLILGENHLWKGTGIPFDPEGLLSTLPAVVSVIIGYLAGTYVRNATSHSAIMNQFFLAGNGMIFGSLFWGMVFPINKALWTSTFVLMTSGIALVCIAFLIYFIDVREKKRWIQPFLVFGLNPLIIYVLSIVWVKIYFRIHIGDQNMYGALYTHVFQPLAGDLNGSLLFALSHVAVLWLIGLVLYKKKIIIKI